MISEQKKTIFTVPLNCQSDSLITYKPINYSEYYSWNDDDKIAIEQIVHEFFNSFDQQGEKIINTSVGKIKITHQIHPEYHRFKLIQGFLLEPLQLKADLKEENWQPKHFLYLLQETNPTWVKNNPDATPYFELLNKEISHLIIEEEALKESIFFLILDLLESICKESINDQGLQTRLHNLIESVKTFNPKNLEYKLHTKHDNDTFRKE